MTAPTRMLLVRHGESTWNAVRRWQGQADPPLSDRGVEQAQTAAGRLPERIDGVVTSTLRRARQTGALVAEVAGLPVLAAVAALQERAAGTWEGLTRAEIERLDPGALAEHRRPEGYEPDAEVVERAVAALRDLALRHAGQHLLVVSHGGVVGALQQHVENRPWRRFDNLEGRWFEVRRAGIRTVGRRVHLLAGEAPGGDRDPLYA